MSKECGMKRALAGHFMPNHWSLLKCGTLSALDKDVLEYLLYRTNPGNGHAWPGEDNIAETLGTSIKTIQRCVYKLSGLGLISVTMNFVGRANGYVVNVDKLEAFIRGVPAPPVAPAPPQTQESPQSPPQAPVEAPFGPDVAGEMRDVPPGATLQQCVDRMHWWKRRYNEGNYYATKSALERKCQRILGWTGERLDKAEFLALHSKHGEAFASLIRETFDPSR